MSREIARIRRDTLRHTPRHAVLPAVLAALLALTLLPGLGHARESGTHAEAGPVRIVLSNPAVFSDLEVGMLAKVRGRVPGARKGARVFLQRRLIGGTRWNTIGQSTAQRRGRFTLAESPTRPGLSEYRVLAPKSKRSRRAVSAPVRARTWEVRILPNELADAPRENMQSTNPEIDGTTEELSLVTKAAGVPAFAEYDLAGRCATLTLAFALTDNAAPGSSGSVRVIADGAVVAQSGDLTAGPADAPIDVDVTGAQTLRFEATTSGAPPAEVAILTPLVRCA